MTRPSIDEIVRRVLDSLPRGFADADADLRRNLRAGISGVLSRMDLVTREEFDAQSRVLARTREKLEALQRQVDELEAVRRDGARPPDSSGG
jgi:BMFP domain-containing protein YqiC